MNKTDKIGLRVRALKFNLDQMNSAYAESQRDSFRDVGIDIEKSYPYNDEIRELEKKQKQLKKSREDVLFFTIFNFTQVFYSIKEYLRKEHPAKKEIIEKFYSDKDVNFSKARKDISNDLKHNPSSDLKYGLGKVGKTEIRIEGSRMIRSSKSRRSWFYYDVDTVEYCNNLYKDLIQFMTLNKLG